MNTDDVTGRSLRRIAIMTRAGALPMLSLLAASAVLGSGCGSSSGNGQGEFEGTWRMELGPGSTATFQLTCPATGVSGSLPLWDRLVLEPGTVSDLVETSGPSNCQFGFDIDSTGKVASVAASDPYTMLPTECSVLIDSGADAAGNAHDLILDMKPSSWVFSLLAPTKGAPPPGQLVGSVVGTLVDVNLTANTSADIDTCTYVVSAMFTKISN